MNIFLKIVFLGLLSSLLGACGEHQSGNSSDEYPSLTLEKLEAKYFILDSVTGPNTNFMGFMEDGGKDLFYMFSSNENALVFFDYEIGKLVKKIEFENEGPNGVGGGSQYKGFQVISLDSILLANSIDSKVYLLNGSGEILKDLQK